MALDEGVVTADLLHQLDAASTGTVLELESLVESLAGEWLDFESSFRKYLRII